MLQGLLFLGLSNAYATKSLDLEKIRNHFEAENFPFAYQGAKILFEQHKNNFEFRILYFRILLNYGRLEEASLQLGWVLKVEEDARTLHLKALLAFARGDLGAASTTSKEALKLDAQHVPSLLLLADIEAENKNLQAAMGWLRSVESFEPEQVDMLFKRGLLEMEAGEGDDALSTVERLGRRHPSSHQYHYLRAFFMFRVGGDMVSRYNAMESLKQALFHKPFSERYLRLKEQLLFEMGRHGDLLAHYQGRKNPTALDHYRVAFLHYDKAGGSLWSVPNLDHLKVNILPKVREALEADSSLELVRRFGEKLLMENSLLDDEEREGFASYHYVRAKDFERRGLVEEAFLEYVWLLNLSPQNADYRRSYAGFLEAQQLYASSLKQLQIAQFLLFDQSDYKVDHKIQLLQKRLKTSLHRVESVGFDSTEPTNAHKIALMVVAPNPNPNRTGSLERPLYHELVHDLLTNSLRSVYSLRLLSSEKETLEQNILEGKPDYLLDYDWELDGNQATLSLKILAQASRKVVHEKVFVDSSKDKCFDINAQAHRFVKGALPVRGVVLKVYPNPHGAKGNLLVSVGRLDEVAVGDVFEVRNKAVSGSSPSELGTVIELDEAMSRVRLDNPEAIGRIRKGFLVQRK